MRQSADRSMFLIRTLLPLPLRIKMRRGAENAVLEKAVVNLPIPHSKVYEEDCAGLGMLEKITHLLPVFHKRIKEAVLELRCLKNYA